MKNVLEGITFDDIKKYANVDDMDDMNFNQNGEKIQILQTFFETQKGKTFLKFALVRFGGYERYDIRTWYDAGEKPGKGMSITYKELMDLKENFVLPNLEKHIFNKRAEYSNGKAHAIIYDIPSIEAFC